MNIGTMQSTSTTWSNDDTTSTCGSAAQSCVTYPSHSYRVTIYADTSISANFPEEFEEIARRRDKDWVETPFKVTPISLEPKRRTLFHRRLEDKYWTGKNYCRP